MTLKRFAGEFKRAIEEAENVLICLQNGNDLDTMGSGFALARLLEENHKNIKTARLLQLRITQTRLGNIKKYEFLPSEDPAPGPKTLFITVDLNACKQINPETLQIAKQCGKVMRIDHHDEVEDLTLEDEKIEAISLNLPSYSSCCEVIWDLAKEMKWEVQPSIGEILFKGLYVDSRRFTGEKVSAQTFKNIYEIYESGADCKAAITSLSVHPIRELFIVADLIKAIQIDKKMAVINLTPEIVHRYLPRNLLKTEDGKLYQKKLLTFPLNIIESLTNAKIVFYIHYSLPCPYDSNKKFLIIVLKHKNENIEKILLDNKFKKNRNRFSKPISFPDILAFLSEYRRTFSNFIK